MVRVTCNVRETVALDHCIVLPTGSTPADPVLQRMVDEWSAAARAKPAARHGEPVAIPFTFNFNQRLSRTTPNRRAQSPGNEVSVTRCLAPFGGGPRPGVVMTV